MKLTEWVASTGQHHTWTQSGSCAINCPECGTSGVLGFAYSPQIGRFVSFWIAHTKTNSSDYCPKSADYIPPDELFKILWDEAHKEKR